MQKTPFVLSCSPKRTCLYESDDLYMEYQEYAGLLPSLLERYEHLNPLFEFVWVQTTPHPLQNFEEYCFVHWWYCRRCGFLPNGYIRNRGIHQYVLVWSGIHDMSENNSLPPWFLLVCLLYRSTRAFQHRGLGPTRNLHIRVSCNRSGFSVDEKNNQQKCVAFSSPQAPVVPIVIFVVVAF